MSAEVTRPPLFSAFRGMRGVSVATGLWTITVLIFLYVPILLLILYSFNNDRFVVVWSGFTFKWYGEVWKDTALVDALKASLFVAFITTALATLLGTSSAWLLHKYRFPFMRTVNTLVVIPMIIPEIIMGISLLIFFAAIKFQLGYMTIIISHVTFCFPFVMVAVQARLQGIDPSLEEAALDLGATPLVAFFRVIVPFLLPAIISGALMSFTLSMDELIVTFFTTGPGTKTLPLIIFGKLKIGLNPTLNAISTLFIIATAMLVIVAESIKKFNK